MHLFAQRGWWDNLLANDLKGAEDHLGRGVAKKRWDELSMGVLREKALLEVEEEYKSGRLAWDQVKRIIEPFPKRGQLDTYIEGMDDEGGADEIEMGVLPWDDEERLSESEGEIEKASALADALPQHIMRRALSDAQQRCAEEGKAQLARLYRIREGARHLPNPRIRHMIDATINSVEVQVRGAKQTDQDIAADIRSAFDEESARYTAYSRPLAKRARVAKAIAKPVAKPIVLNHIAASARRLLRRPVCLHVPREFTASDLGQGRCAGGTQVHFRCRFELFARIARLYGNLGEEVQANLDRVFKMIDDHRRHAGGGKRYGSVFRNDMKDLQAKYRAGEMEALLEWVLQWLRIRGRRSVHVLC